MASSTRLLPRSPLVLLVWLALVGCGPCGRPDGPTHVVDPPAEQTPSPSIDEFEGVGSPLAPPLAEGQREAVFAGGCFWCMERPFEELDGVIAVVSGYTGGRTERPTYRQVSAGITGHYEAVRVVYDPARITYARLLEVFFRNVDPTQGNGQFCDRGEQYRSAIFVRDASERAAARAALDDVARRLGRRIVTSILDVAPFYVAEAYHQDYHRTHPVEYAAYRHGCGRDARLRELWGDAAGAHGGDGTH